MSDKRIDDFVIEEQAKADALYPHTKNDVEPVIEGAYKGALVGGLGLRIFDSSRNVKTKLAGTLMHIGGGALSGGIYGKLSNNAKVEKAKEARKFLAGQRVSKKYINNKIQLVKQSSASSYLLQKTAGIAHASGIASDEIEDKRKKVSNKESVGKSALWGGGIGGVIGGLATMLGKKKSFTKGFLPMAAIGSANSAATTELDNEEGNSLSPAALSGIGMGAGASVEPLTLRLLGRGYKSVGSDPKSYFTDKENKELNDSIKWAKNGKGIGHNLAKYLLPNIASKSKSEYNSDNIDLHKGMTGEKIFDKSLFGHMAGKALWGGALGYGIVKLPELYIKHKQAQNEKNKK